MHLFKKSMPVYERLFFISDVGMFNVTQFKSTINLIVYIKAV